MYETSTEEITSYSFIFMVMRPVWYARSGMKKCKSFTALLHVNICGEANTVHKNDIGKISKGFYPVHNSWKRRHLVHS